MGAQIAYGKTFEQFARPGRRRIGFNALRGQLAGQLVVDRQVELPQLLGAPRRHDAGIDRADIGVGHQRQRLEALDGLHLVRHVADGLRVEQVARLHGLGKLQVLADQKEHGFAIRLRHLDARHGVSRQAHARHPRGLRPGTPLPTS